MEVAHRGDRFHISIYDFIMDLGFVNDGGHFLNDMCWSMGEFVKPDGEVRMDMMDILPCVALRPPSILLACLGIQFWKKHTVNQIIADNNPLRAPFTLPEYVCFGE